MKSLELVLIAAASVVASGCTPDWARQNETGFILEIASISGTTASGSSGQGGEIRSDVLTGGSVFNDDATVAVNVLRKNNNPDLGVSPVEHVYLDRYEVVYFRTDGRNTEGVDVPYRITGPLGNLRFHTASPGGQGEVEQTVTITVVRHTAKLEPPLSNLRNIFNASPGGSPIGPFQFPGQGIITTVAEITIHGHTIQGDGLEAKGRVQVTFADFADSAGGGQ
jgi:hypothetical protein